MNPIATAAAGVLSGLARFDSAGAAATKAFDPISTADPAGAIVGQITAGEQVQASITTLRVSDWMLKQLLDIRV